MASRLCPPINNWYWLVELGEVASRIEENSLPGWQQVTASDCQGGWTEILTTLWKESWRELLGKRTFHCAHILCLALRASDAILLEHSFWRNLGCFEVTGSSLILFPAMYSHLVNEFGLPSPRFSAPFLVILVGWCCFVVYFFLFVSLFFIR